MIKLSKKQTIILWVTVILIVIFLGLSPDGPVAIRGATPYGTSLYGMYLGTIGIAHWIFLYKYQLIVATLLIGFALFITAKESKPSSEQLELEELTRKIEELPKEMENCPHDPSSPEGIDALSASMKKLLALEKRAAAILLKAKGCTKEQIDEQLKEMDSSHESHG